MQIIDSTPAALSADLQMYLRNGDVFFDIETTGLSWRTSHLYLIGALFFDPAADTFTLRQWFLDRPTEEKEMLVSFFTFLSDVKQLVHFNGTTFDLPYLTHKALFYQMEDPLSSIASLDLYQALRPFQSILGLSSMKQKNVEQYLSFPRKDQLNGKQLISVYHDYLQTLDEKKLELLFLHNYEDVLGMGSVLELLALPALFHGDFSAAAPAAPRPPSRPEAFRQRPSASWRCVVRASGRFCGRGAGTAPRSAPTGRAIPPARRASRARLRPAARRRAAPCGISARCWLARCP